MRNEKSGASLIFQSNVDITASSYSVKTLSRGEEYSGLIGSKFVTYVIDKSLDSSFEKLSSYYREHSSLEEAKEYHDRVVRELQLSSFL